MYKLTFQQLQNQPPRTYTDQQESDRYDLGSNIRVTHLGVKFCHDEITQLWLKKDTQSFWIATQDKDMRTDIIDLSVEETLIWDRDMSELIQNKFDQLDYSDEMIKTIIQVKPAFENAIKKHYVERILAKNRFPEQLVAHIVNSYINIDASKTIGQNLHDKAKRLSIEKLRQIISKLQSSQREHSRILTAFDFDDEWSFIIRPIGISVISKMTHAASLNAQFNNAVLQGKHSATAGHGLITLLKA